MLRKLEIVYSCPLSRICQTEGVVYQATVTREDNGEEKTYVGLTEARSRQDTTTTPALSETQNASMPIRCPILDQMENK